MNYEQVMKHVEKVSGEPRANFANARQKEVRMFSSNNAQNVAGECVIHRFGIGGPIPSGLNGDKTKQYIQDRLGLEVEDDEKSGKVVVKYRIVGLAKRATSSTAPPTPPSVRAANAG